jgi:hypothetical protein
MVTAEGTPDTVGTVSRCLRVTTIGPGETDHELDAALRAIGPATGVLPGNLGVWLGRRSVSSLGERVLVSVWSSRQAHDRALAIARDVLLGQPPVASIAGQKTDVLPVEIEASFPRDRPMTILRVFRGRTYPGQRATYLTEAAAGVLIDGERPDGPGALICGLDGDDGFVTVSLWPDWAAIEACTGGDMRRPLLTRNAARIEHGAPTHYELVG